MAEIQSIPALSKLAPPARSHSNSLMRHNEDIRCIISTVLFFAVFVITWQTFTSPFTGGLLSILAWLSLFQLSFMGAVTTHNAIHLPIFWNKNWNKVYQICLSICLTTSILNKQETSVSASLFLLSVFFALPCQQLCIVVKVIRDP
jgi:hypothetical protein